MEHLFKGNLQASRGLWLNYMNLFPSFAYQNKFLTWTILDSYSSNDQNSRSELERTFGDTYILQELDRKTKGYQHTISSRLKASLPGKSALSLSGSFFQYRYKSNASGSIRENEQLRDLEYESTCTTTGQKTSSSMRMQSARFQQFGSMPAKLFTPSKSSLCSALRQTFQPVTKTSAETMDSGRMISGTHKTFIPLLPFLISAPATSPFIPPFYMNIPMAGAAAKRKTTAISCLSYPPCTVWEAI